MYTVYTWNKSTWGFLLNIKKNHIDILLPPTEILLVLWRIVDVIRRNTSGLWNKMEVHIGGRGNSVTQHKINEANLCLSNYFISVSLLKQRTVTIKTKQPLYSYTMTPGPFPLKAEEVELTPKENTVTKTRIRRKRWICVIR